MVEGIPLHLICADLRETASDPLQVLALAVDQTERASPRKRAPNLESAGDPPRKRVKREESSENEEWQPTTKSVVKNYWRKTCKFKNCHACSRRGGYCYWHGGKILCNEEHCIKVAVCKGKCAEHGPRRHAVEEPPLKDECAQDVCPVQGCDAFAPYGDKCGKHGGKKRCSERHCPKLAVRHGKCNAHGPRCAQSRCLNAPVRNSRCARHQWPV